jgi:flagellar basal body-associated protein FliL
MNKKLVIIGASALVGVLGAGAGVYFFKPDLFPGSVGSNGAASAKPAKTETKDKKHETEVGADLEVFVVNLASSGQGRYLRTTLSLGVKSEHEKERV